jgi:hypothetical protein
VKVLTIVGAVLAIFGGVVLARGLTYPSEKTVLQVGSMEIKAESQRSIPPVVGGVALLGGLVLIGMGLSGKKFT